MGLDVRTRPPEFGGPFLSSAARTGAVPAAVTRVTALMGGTAVTAPLSPSVQRLALRGRCR